jgi:hypothetical protein
MSGGLFDWHVLGILSRTWRELLATDPARFVRLFASGDGTEVVPQSVLESWHAELTRGATQAERTAFVRFTMAYSPNAPQVPQVVIAGGDSPAENQPLGQAGPVDADGNKTYTMLVREQVSAEIITHHPDLTRALHVVIQRILMSQSDDFARLGYHGPFYLGADDLMPSEDLMPGAALIPQIFIRRQRWYSIAQRLWRGGTVSSKPHHVYAADVTVDGVVGGVSADYTATPQPPAPSAPSPPPPPPPILMAKIRHADSSHIKHDGLATSGVAWRRLGSRWTIHLVRSSTSAAFERQLWHVGSNNGGFDHPFAELTLRFNFADLTAVSERNTGTGMYSLTDFSTALNDDTWHLFMSLDAEEAFDRGRIYLKTDGAPRLPRAFQHVRGFDEDPSFPLWCTIGALRRGALGAPAAYSDDMDVIYMAHISDCVPSDAQMDAVWTAFNTGGGRTDLQAITDAVQSVVTSVGTGQIDWAGPVDGTTPSHVDAVGAGLPVLVNTSVDIADGL